jgi:hypothetical protein
MCLLVQAHASFFVDDDGCRDAKHIRGRFGNPDESAISQLHDPSLSGQPATVDLLEGARAQGYDFRLLQKPRSLL